MSNMLFVGGSEFHETLFYGEPQYLKNKKKYKATAWYGFTVYRKRDEFNMVRFMTEDGEVFSTYDPATVAMFEYASKMNLKTVSFQAVIKSNEED